MNLISLHKTVLLKYQIICGISEKYVYFYNKNDEFTSYRNICFISLFKE